MTEEERVEEYLVRIEALEESERTCLEALEKAHALFQEVLRFRGALTETLEARIEDWCLSEFSVSQEGESDA